MVRILVHDDQIIKLSGQIGVVVSFIAHPDVTSSHGRDKSKVYQGILESRMEPGTRALEAIECSLE